MKRVEREGEMEPLDNTPTAPRLSAVRPIITAQLFSAAENGDFNALVNMHEGPGAVNEHGNTLLHRAIQFGHYKCVEWLIGSAKEDVAAKNANGDTPLHIAAYYERPAAVQLLLSVGAPLEALNKNGQTPLTVALIRLDRQESQGKEEMVKLLLERGADKTKVKGILLPAWCQASVLVTPTVRKRMEQEAIQANLRANQWACPTCTFANDQTSAECVMCGTATIVVKAGAAVEPWVCKACTYHNEPETVECEMCGTAK